MTQVPRTDDQHLPCLFLLVSLNGIRDRTARANCVGVLNPAVPSGLGRRPSLQRLGYFQISRWRWRIDDCTVFTDGIKMSKLQAAARMAACQQLEDASLIPLAERPATFALRFGIRRPIEDSASSGQQAFLLFGDLGYRQQARIDGNRWARGVVDIRLGVIL